MLRFQIPLMNLKLLINSRLQPAHLPRQYVLDGALRLVDLAYLLPVYLFNVLAVGSRRAGHGVHRAFLHRSFHSLHALHVLGVGVEGILTCFQGVVGDVLHFLPLRLILRQSHEHQINLWLERILVQAVVPEESLEGEGDDVIDLFVVENKDAKRWSLYRVLRQYLLEQLHSLLLRHLMLDHIMQQEIHDGQQRAHLFVRV